MVSGLTTGKIPKAASATSLTDSLLSDDGTNIKLASGQLLLPDGNVTTPALGWSSSGNEGIYHSTNIVAVKAGGQASVFFTGAAILPGAAAGRTVGNSGSRWSAGYFGGNIVTASTPGFDLAQTWNASGVSFIGATMAFTENASAAGSLYFQILGGASASTTEFYVGKGGVVYANGPVTANGVLTASTGLVSSSSSSPASGAACTVGTISWDPSYIYVCTASGAWKRAALTGGY